MSWRTKQVAVVNMSTVVVLLPLIVAGCSNSTSDEPVSTVDDVSLDVTAADASPVDVAPSIDSAGGDAAADAQDAQDTQDAPVCPGGAGCPCAQNVDCDGGLCLEGADGPRCARACVDSCEEGFTCAQVPQGSDVVTVCVASWARLCVPCVQNADCVHPGVKGARCVDRGDSGSFCGGGCGDDGDCPKGYACKNAKDVEGDSATQCVPVDATGQLTECLCNANALTLAVKTPCAEAVIEEGVELVCPGWARCTQAGAVAKCEASEPGAEACDGLDNDCDGQVDEGACDDDNPCTQDACDLAVGCTYTALQDGTACDADGSVCTDNDACAAGSCVAGVLLGCDDGNPCTKDACLPASGCTQTDFDGLPCDDDNPCTIGDVCTAGGCVSGKTKSCAPPNSCYSGACDLLTGKCAFDYVVTGVPCDDGNACTGSDGCAKGKCVGELLDCDDNNPCTTDSCDLANGCTQSNNDAACDDGNACTLGDGCVGGACQPGKAKACDDSNPCTADSCDGAKGACQFLGAPQDGATCDADGSVCTVNDACKGGQCVSGKAKDCDDGNPCTTDACDAKTGCTAVANQSPCDDGDQCTLADTCADKVCKAGALKSCDDNNPCTIDTCAPKTGACGHDGKAVEAKPCDADGSLCTVGDSCKAGVCSPGPAAKCGDGNACTTDSCAPQSGCVNVANQGSCDDGNPCTNGDGCTGKACVAGALKKCDDTNPCTVDTCDNKTGKCVFSGATQDGSPCDADGNVCTDKDQCKSGVCVKGKLKVCDDGNLCTDDACDAKLGCVASANVAPCDDGDACTTGDVCAKGKCAGATKSCDDKNPCTTDTCASKGGCQSAAVKDGLSCDTGSGVSWCQAGKCVPKTANGQACAKSAQCASGYCVEGVCCDGACGGTCLSCLGKHTGASDGQCKAIKAGGDPDNECLSADVSTCGQTGACDGAGKCAVYADGTKCKAASCGAFGHQAAGQCVGGACVGGKVTGCDDGNGCTKDTCDVVKVCVHTETGNSCDDKDACTSGETCVVSGPQKVYTGKAPDGFGQCKGKAVNCDDGKPCTKDSCDAAQGCINAPQKDETLCTTDGSKWCQQGKCISRLGTKGYPAVTCKAILDGGASKGSGVYWLKSPSSASAVQAYCEMVADGGGWTLILNQVDNTFHHLKSSPTELTSLNSAGVQTQLFKILSVSNEIRYADTSGKNFLWATFNGATYANALQSTGSTAVPVTYKSGTLSGKQRYIEVSSIFHWGHRHNVPFVGGKATHVKDVFNDTCRHTCWEDVDAQLQDRPFAGDHCPSDTTASFCPGIAPGYSFPPQATRNGSFNYRKWVR